MDITSYINVTKNQIIKNLKVYAKKIVIARGSDSDCPIALNNWVLEQYDNR